MDFYQEISRNVERANTPNQLPAQFYQIGDVALLGHGAGSFFRRGPSRCYVSVDGEALVVKPVSPKCLYGSAECVVW
jgi:hypothetical protein